MVSQTHRVRQEPVLAVQQMLKGIVGGIADVGLGIDDEPWLALGRENVVRMEVRAKQHSPIGCGGQAPEKRHAFSRKTRIDARSSSRRLLLELAFWLLVKLGLATPGRRDALEFGPLDAA